MAFKPFSLEYYRKYTAWCRSGYRSFQFKSSEDFAACVFFFKFGSGVGTVNCKSTCYCVSCLSYDTRQLSLCKLLGIPNTSTSPPDPPLLRFPTVLSFPFALFTFIGVWTLWVVISIQKTWLCFVSDPFTQCGFTQQNVCAFRQVTVESHISRLQRWQSCPSLRVPCASRKHSTHVQPGSPLPLEL